MAIEVVVHLNCDEFGSWLNGTDDQLLLSGNYGSYIGIVLLRGDTSVYDASKLKVIFRRSTGELGYFILTAYPTLSTL